MLPTQELLNEILRYDRITGKLYWRERGRHLFPVGKRRTRHKANNWNAKHAGKEAFTSLDNRGYRQGSIFGKHYRAHRIIWVLVYGMQPNQIDHINGNKLDNRLINIRSVSNKENHKNLKRPSNNTSGSIGVVWYKANCKWSSRIVVNGKHIHLGYFDNFDDAVASRKTAEMNHGFHKNHGRVV